MSFDGAPLCERVAGRAMNSSDDARFRVCSADSPRAHSATPVVTKARILVLCAALALQAWASPKAAAQREVVRDSWAEAEAAMLHEPSSGVDKSGDGVALRRPQSSDSRHRRGWRAARRARRDAIRSERQDRVNALRLQARRARTPEGGPLSVRLGSAGDLDWVWLGADGDPRLLRDAPRLCTDRCVLHLAPWRYRFGMRYSRHHGAVAPELDLTQSGAVTAHYQSRRAWRIGGVLMIVAGAATAGGVGLRLAFFGPCGLFAGSSCSTPTPLAARIAMPLGLAVVFVGLTFVITSDRRVELEFRPSPRM